MYLVNGYRMKEVKSVEEAHAEIKKELEKQNLSYNKVFSFANENLIIEIYEYHTYYKETFLIIPHIAMQKYCNLCPEYRILDYTFERGVNNEVIKQRAKGEIDSIIKWERASEYNNIDWWNIEIKGCINLGETKL